MKTSLFALLLALHCIAAPAAAPIPTHPQAPPQLDRPHQVRPDLRELNGRRYNLQHLRKWYAGGRVGARPLPAWDWVSGKCIVIMPDGEGMILERHARRVVVRHHPGEPGYVTGTQTACFAVRVGAFNWGGEQFPLYDYGRPVE